MKKTLYIIILLAIPAILSAGDARVERWNSRIERLNKYKSEVSGNPVYDPSAVSLFNDEIKSAEEFISVLGKYSSGDGSVKAESRKYTVQEIEAYTSEIANPVISVYYSAEMVKACSNPLLKSAVKDDINRYAESKGFPAYKKESRDAEEIAGRYILQRYISGYENFRKKAESEILGMTEYELSRTGYNSNKIDLTEMIIKSAEKVCSSPLNTETAFNENYLASLPEWKEHERSSDTLNSKMNAVISFAESHGTTITPEDRKKGIEHVENITFNQPGTTIIMMCENTEKAQSTGYNNPVYEIPDFRGIQKAVEEIDRYRGTLSVSVTGAEGNAFINRVKNNNRGLAERYIKQYDNLYARERQRISGLRSKNSSIIIYNEEIFNASEKHFAEIKGKLIAYADLSADYIEAVYSSGRIDPEKYIADYDIKTERKLNYASFIEKLTADSTAAGETADTPIVNTYKGSAKDLLNLTKSMYIPEQIPVNIRSTMTKEHIRSYNRINDSLRVKGTALSVSARKNYEAFLSAYAGALSSKRSGEIASETSIGQDEVDRLMSCAKKCSESAASFTYTSEALKNYLEEYNRITGDIRDGKDLSQYLEKINSGSIIPLVQGFSTEKIDSETKLRDMLVREGSESLSGAIALMQYYSRRGFALKYTYTTEDIKAIKEKLVSGPEVTISSWKMNGKNYRLVDTNSTEGLKKLINRKAWHPVADTGQKQAKEKFSPDGKIEFAISLPDGWNRSAASEDSSAALSLSLKSPDLQGKIILRTVKSDNDNIQLFSDEWNRTNGFTQVAKEWGKQNGSDFLMTVSKNKYNAVMESYIIRKDGYVIQVTGITDKKMQATMNRNLKDIFSSLEI